eukprot:XP_011435757.1 PREDICTED: uncharacterized protein K02A2.6-like [Crassostrea gigas]
MESLNQLTSREVIRKLRSQFARHGIPDICMSDNGPQFASEEFADFEHLWEFDHITSSPHYPHINWKAEKAVKVARQILKKAKHTKSNPYLALLDYRNTPTHHVGTSPAMRLMETKSYEVKAEAGADYTRNRKHLRKSMEGPYDNPDVPEDNPNCTSNDNKGANPGPNTDKDPETITTRSGREVKPPVKYNDFVKS